MSYIFGKLLCGTCIAGVMLFMCTAACFGRNNVAGVVKAGFPGEDAALIEVLSREIINAGYKITPIDGDALCDPNRMTQDKFGLLVLPNAAALPAKASASIEGYLKQGGDIIALNAPMWQQSLIKVDGTWTTQAQYQLDHAKELPPNIFCNFSEQSISAWQRTSSKMDSPAAYETVTTGPAPGQRALHAVIDNMQGWDNYGPRNLDKPFPNDHKLTVFSAKGDANTAQLAIEWAEKDGSRWIAVVGITPQWRQFVLRPEDFIYWQSNPARGGRGDHFRPENAASLSFGLAFSHTGNISGRYEYWVGPFGTAKVEPKYEELLSAAAPLKLDILSPGYKFFDVNDAASITSRADQTIIDSVSIPVPSGLRSPQPRPKGAGFDKRRDWRWIPLLDAHAADGEWRGTPAAMLIHTGGQYKGGIWASFGLAGNEPYKDPAVLKIVRRIAQRMKDRIFILDGGANYYTYFEDQRPTLGLRIANLGDTERSNLHANLRLSPIPGNSAEAAKVFNVAVKPGDVTTVSTEWTPGTWPKDGYRVTAELLDNDKIIDSVQHEINVWKPKDKKEQVTVEDGRFMLSGKQWRAHGVNYMPSSGIGTEDGEYFEHWLGARSYDPEVIDRDLSHIQDMGLNAVSIFCYSDYANDQNLVDILARLEKRGIKASVSLRPGTPLDFEWEQIRHIIERCRLAQSDAIFAYDLAWEPMFGTHDERVKWDGEWQRWITERYANIAGAEKDWGFPVPRDKDGNITNPYPEQIDTHGKWRKMTAAYRRFLDTLLYKKYSAARKLVRGIDPNHLVSFRMAEAANPTYHWEGRIPYDFPYLAGAVDFLAPEAYGRIGDWESVKPGWFEREYARWAAPEKPMIWAEMGTSAWELSRMQTNPERLKFQAMFFEHFYRMMLGSGADGVFYWWYPGGFRVGENSDFGIINPDGTDRPVTKVIRDNAKRFFDAPSKRAVDSWITIDRDAHPDGPAGIYDECKAKFWAATDAGKIVALKTNGTGMNSANCPLLAVGSGKCTGQNPPKFLDAAIDAVAIQDANGNWVEVENGAKIKAGKTAPAVQISFTNLGEAKLLSYPDGKLPGGVYITAHSSAGTVMTGIPSKVDHLASGQLRGVKLLPASVSLNTPTQVTITFTALGRTEFGEKFRVILEP